jgi:hypothetical protein
LKQGLKALREEVAEVKIINKALEERMKNLEEKNR